MKIIVYFFCGFLIATSIYNTNAIEIYKNGHASKIWNESETIIELKKFEQSKNPIYSNEPAVIYLFLERSSIYLPIKHNIHTSRANPNYQEELDKIMEEIKEKDGLLVFFDGGWGVFPNEQEVDLDNEFYLFKDTADGAIYRIKN